MKRHKLYNKRAEELMKKLFEKQGIKNVDLSVKEAAELDDMTKDAHKEEECDEGVVANTKKEAQVKEAPRYGEDYADMDGDDEERDFDMDIKDAQEIYDEVEQALEGILGNAMTESIMEKIEDDIKDFAMAIAEEVEAKKEEIKKSKIAATQEEINSLKAKLEAIKNDEGEVIEGEEKKPDEDGDGVPDWADKKPGKDDTEEDK